MELRRNGKRHTIAADDTTRPERVSILGLQKPQMVQKMHPVNSLGFKFNHKHSIMQPGKLYNHAQKPSNPGCILVASDVQQRKARNNASTGAEDEILDIDLYGDLEVDVSQELSYNEMKALCEKHETTVKELQKENKFLKEQNDVLKKNISSLFLTAQNEITRKDAEIKRLQDREVRSRKSEQLRQNTKENESA